MFVPRKSLPHETPAWVKTGSLYFFTLCAEPRGFDLLTGKNVAPSLLSAVENYHLALRWHVRLFLLMPDHLHALISFPSGESMRACWRDWKRFTSKKTGIIWQRDFFDHRIRNDESWQAKADYILQNPVRKKLVARSEDWPWVFIGE